MKRMATSDRLPREFLERVRELVGPELGRFVQSLDERRSRALRVNPAKTDADELRRLLGLQLRPLPWSGLGFELPGDAPPLGAHPAHLAGLFYLQEPSSVSVPEILRPEPGWRVADVAAAPGGKTTHLLSLVGDGGAVVANDVNPSRLRVLHENVDRWGAANVVTSRLPVGALAESLEQPLDAVVLDAPCTGEALFRRDPKLVREWSVDAVRGAARRQAQLLSQAAGLVRAGGLLVYSTCSFQLEENEENVAGFLSGHPGWLLEDAVVVEGARRGHRVGTCATELTARLWPHDGPGEGQFAAKLRRVDVPRVPTREAGRQRAKRRPDRPGTSSVKRLWHEFAQATMPEFVVEDDRLAVRGQHVFLVPERPPGISENALARPGMPLGTARPGRFEPAPALATHVEPHLVRNHVCWSADDPRLRRYLRGETVPSSGPDGWILVGYERWGLGWGRRTGGVIKNFFPRRLRTQARS
jgi:16S rRNA C967 or C1407 C5-methylase (RsmB/RsmF family)/NOL1/NOP2/fmu family ribosome biogenesis protein